MAKKPILASLELKIQSVIDAVTSGFIGLGAKSDGLFIKTATAEEKVYTDQGGRVRTIVVEETAEMLGDVLMSGSTTSFRGSEVDMKMEYLYMRNRPSGTPKGILGITADDEVIQVPSDNFPIHNNAAQINLATDTTVAQNTWSNVLSMNLTAGTYLITGKMFVVNGTGTSLYRFIHNVNGSVYDIVQSSGNNDVRNLHAIVTLTGSASIVLQSYTTNTGITLKAAATLGGVNHSGLTRISYVKLTA